MAAESVREASPAGSVVAAASAETVTAALPAAVVAAPYAVGDRATFQTANGPRMVPWRFLMLLCAALVMLLLIHLIALLGGGPVARPY